MDNLYAILQNLTNLPTVEALQLSVREQIMMLVKRYVDDHVYVMSLHTLMPEKKIMTSSSLRYKHFIIYSQI